MLARIPLKRIPRNTLLTVAYWDRVAQGSLRVIRPYRHCQARLPSGQFATRAWVRQAETITATEAAWYRSPLASAS